MADHDYLVIVLGLSEDDGGGFLAVAPDLPGCMGDGESRAAAVADLERAMAEWIDEANRLNRKVPKAGSCFAKAADEQKKIKNLLKAQEELIKQQETRIVEQDRHLDSARKEIDRIKASIMEKRESHSRVHDELYPWNVLSVVPAEVAEQITAKRYHGRRLN